MRMLAGFDEFEDRRLLEMMLAFKALNRISPASMGLGKIQ